LAEPLKHLLNREAVKGLAAHLDLPAAFERRAVQGLEALELKARAMQLAHALEAALPARFDAAAVVLERGFARGLAGWALWPVGEFVARRGIDEPERALAVLHGLTQKFTAEWAIRPFIVRHPALSFATLARWTGDGSDHVRRLVSEGSRPRLPWGLQLRSLIADPSPTLPLLEALQDDESEYVRRSVANHLNDIAKDHPARVAEWLERHLEGASEARQRLLRHASRTLVKRGDPRVLTAWGLGAPLAGRATLRIAPARIVLGEAVTLEVALRSSTAQALQVDYAVHHVKADGRSAAKVFKGWSLALAAGETRVLARRHAVRPITTRRYFAGVHRVDLLVNGRVAAQASFRLALE
jgi:3-methyladenine DNA glycosylase AlkC